MEPIRRLEYEYRVRSDEADADGWLRPSGLTGWCATYSSRSTRPSPTATCSRSAPRSSAGAQVWARRHSHIMRIESSAAPREPQHMAAVRTDWVLLTSDGRPARVPAEISRNFSPDQPFVRVRIAMLHYCSAGP